MNEKQHYVIYYGRLIKDQTGIPNQTAQIIASVQPQMLITPFEAEQEGYINLSYQVRELFKEAGVAIVAHLPASYGLRGTYGVEKIVRQYLEQGVKGIFFDEVYPFQDRRCHYYYRRLYELTKEKGGFVILNAGSSLCESYVMEMTDILMVENRWREFYQNCAWCADYEATRFMGTSNNESGSFKRLGYKVNLFNAITDTFEAWRNGIGWHYSTNHYSELPSWFHHYSLLLSLPNEEVIRGYQY